MKNLRDAQIIVKKINAKYNSLDSVSWNTVYNSESEIMEDLKQIHIPDKNEPLAVYRLYKGYEYIHSFAKQVQNEKTLSEKQVRQCKRLALEIKKAASIKDCY